MKTDVAIIGAGPAGLLLGRLLAKAGIDFVILEQRSRAYVEGRVRAGVLEQGTVDILDRAEVSTRLHGEALKHAGFHIAFTGARHRVDLEGCVGRSVTVYGQSEITKDLIAAHDADGTRVWFETEVTAVTPRQVIYEKSGVDASLECEFVVGCDGQHGICRESLPHDRFTIHEHAYPFAWLGVLSDTPPVSDELIYARGESGFALCSMRSTTRSRYYVQVGADAALDDWPDERFWQVLRSRLPEETAHRLVDGPSIEKSVAPLRSAVVEPMRWDRLFLAGDAAHIVPPTGAKGLNLAAADVWVLAQALVRHFEKHDDALLDAYSTICLERVWAVQRFSWWYTSLTHRFGTGAYSDRLQLAELRYVTTSRAAMTTLAENYVGLPLEIPA